MNSEILLFENKEFIVFTPHNPHVPAKEGLHVVVKPKKSIKTPWESPVLTGRMFEVAAIVTQEMSKLKLAPWFNLQANGNWGLLPGNKPFFHVHIYARRKGKTWAQPVRLPKAPATFNHAPMKAVEVEKLRAAFNKRFSKFKF